MTRGKLTAYVIVAVFIGIICFLGVRSVSGPPTFPGDKLETRTCRQCDGSGTSDEPGASGRCPFCAGRKTCQVILPGPNHPVPIRGVVVDVAAYKDKSDAEFNALLELNDTVSLKKVKGGVADATLTCDSGSNKIELHTAATGKIRGALAPGDYDVKIHKDGYSDTTMKLKVPVRSQPIWLELAKLKTPDPDVVNFAGVLSK